jgi:hypothetical protein
MRTESWISVTEVAGAADATDAPMTPGHGPERTQRTRNRRPHAA